MRKQLKIAKLMLQTRNCSFHMLIRWYNVYKIYSVQLLAPNISHYKRKCYQPLVALPVFWTPLLPHIMALSCQDLFPSLKPPNLKLNKSKNLKLVASKSLDSFLLQSKINQLSAMMMQSLSLKSLLILQQTETLLILILKLLPFPIAFLKLLFV